MPTGTCLRSYQARASVLAEFAARADRNLSLVLSVSPAVLAEFAARADRNFHIDAERTLLVLAEFAARADRNMLP